MKGWVLALSVALLLDGALYWGLSRVSVEKEDLARRREELQARVEALRESGAWGRQIETLLRQASASLGEVARDLDIAELRDLLIGAERGLDIDRLSLDFRPSSDAPKGMEGGRVSASLEGAFPAVHAYLQRVEDLLLPLSPESFTLRADEFERVLLTIDWNGLWSLENGTIGELSPGDLARLESWLALERDRRPLRNFFAEGEVPPAEGSPPTPARESSPAEPSLPPLAAESSPPPPRLTGFVIARPELETDVDRRVLAALRFEGELRLVGVGDVVGSYRVEEIDARESVLLVHEESGERLKLFLE
jgi:hypothetical protein